MLEQDIARRCAQGDKDAQRELYTTYAARLKALCYRYTGDEDQALDLMHDAMIKAFGKIQTYRYRGEGSLYAWLRRMTVNLAVDFLRKERFAPEALDNVGEAMVAEPMEEDVRGISAERMAAMVAALPPSRRAVFNLYCIEGYSHREIARMLRISEKGSASILARARTQLKEEINDYLKGQ